MILTKNNIEEINSTLINNRVHYIDLRIEIIDHFVSELENKGGDFEIEFRALFENKKDFIKQTILENQKFELRNGFSKLVKNIFSLRFLAIYIFVAAVLFLISKSNGEDWFLSNFDMLPIIIPAPITLILLYTTFFSKEKSASMIGLLSAANLIFMSYLYFFLAVVRKLENFTWIPVFTFFIALSFSYYIFYFEARKELFLKYKSLWN